MGWAIVRVGKALKWSGEGGLRCGLQLAGRHCCRRGHATAGGARGSHRQQAVSNWRRAPGHGFHLYVASTRVGAHKASA